MTLNEALLCLAEARIALADAYAALREAQWQEPPPCTWQEYQDAASRNANDGGTESTPEQIEADIATVGAFYEWAARVLV